MEVLGGVVPCHVQQLFLVVAVTSLSAGKPEEVVIASVAIPKATRLICRARKRWRPWRSDQRIQGAQRFEVATDELICPLKGHRERRDGEPVAQDVVGYQGAFGPDEAVFPVVLVEAVELS